MERKKHSKKRAHIPSNSEYVERSSNAEKFNIKDIQHSECNNKCRICLGAGNISIFGNGESLDISNDIEIFGSILIRKDDNFPKQICEACEKLLQAAVLFRKTAMESDLYLKSSSQENTFFDLVKLEAGSGNEDTTTEATNAEISLLNIKEEIIVEPYFFEDNLINNDNDTLNDSTNTDENSQELQIVENSTVSLLENQYICTTCDLSFETVNKYHQHKKSAQHKKAQNSNKIECEICYKNISKAYYKRHMEAHSNEAKDDKLQCPICNKSYSKTYFNYHLTHSHNKDTKKTEPERIKCQICNKSYEKQYYKFHLATHNKDSSKYVCDTCGKSFIQQSAFKRHCLIHDKELAYKCTLCPYRGRHPGLVKTHMQTHTRDYQHRCMECPAKFLTKSNLNKHVQRHKGPVDFKCETCKKGFYSKLELERHFEVDHLGVKNHICNICGKAFGYRNAMMSHQLKVHKRQKLTNGKGRLPLYLEADKKNDD